LNWGIFEFGVMAFDPDKHHRRSIRLKGFDYSSPGAYFITIYTQHRECLFGEIVDGVMTFNRFGKMVANHWANLTKYHAHVQLDEFVIMPNHVHGIIVLTDVESDPAVGAGFDDPILDKTRSWITKPALPDPSRSHSSSKKGDRASHSGGDGAGFGDRGLDGTEQWLAKPAPTVHGISEIIRGFKTFSARRINQIRQTPGCPVWQRNYYEHIIRDESALQNIRKYIRNNPKSWVQDQLHPDHPSKW
jgi:putative transposase